MQATLEQIQHLPAGEQDLARFLADRLNTLPHPTLEAAAYTLQCFASSWFVYCGGSHVALHRAAGDERRVLIVTER
jgi:hypothetical protein